MCIIHTNLPQRVYAVAILVNLSPLSGYSNYYATRALACASLYSHKLNRLPPPDLQPPLAFPADTSFPSFQLYVYRCKPPPHRLHSSPRHPWARATSVPPCLRQSPGCALVGPGVLKRRRASWGERASGCLKLPRRSDLFAAMSGTRAAVAAANDRASRPAAGAALGVGLKRLRSEPGGNRVTVVLGAQWGDEGKGKVVDLLATEADLVCRCQVSKGCPGTGRAAPRPISLSATLEPVSPLVFAAVAFRMPLFTCAGETSLECLNTGVD